LCTVASDNFIIIVYQNSSGYTWKNDIKIANFDFSVEGFLILARIIFMLYLTQMQAIINLYMNGEG